VTLADAFGQKAVIAKMATKEAPASFEKSVTRLENKDFFIGPRDRLREANEKGKIKPLASEFFLPVPC
jgi:hypothetical protein